MFLNKETGIFLAHRLDFYMDVFPAVSLLRYAKGDGGFPDYAPVFSPSSHAGANRAPELNGSKDLRIQPVDATGRLQSGDHAADAARYAVLKGGYGVQVRKFYA